MRNETGCGREDRSETPLSKVRNSDKLNPHKPFDKSTQNFRVRLVLSDERDHLAGTPPMAPENHKEPNPKSPLSTSLS